MTDATPPVTPPADGDGKEDPIVPPADIVEDEDNNSIDSKEDIEELKKEMEKLQKKNYQIERKALLTELNSLDPKLAEKYSKANVSKLEIVLEAVKDVTDKFAVDKSSKGNELDPKGTYLDRNSMKYV